MLTNQWTWLYEALLEVSMTKIALWIRVWADDLAAESAIKASNDTDLCNSRRFKLDIELSVKFSFFICAWKVAYYFFQANQWKANVRIYFRTPYEISVNWCDWPISAGNEEKIVRDFLTRDNASTVCLSDSAWCKNLLRLNVHKNCRFSSVKFSKTVRQDT